MHDSSDPVDAAAHRNSDDLFDDLIDTICADGSPWQYDQAVHIASDMWDERAYTGPLPSDYVPRAVRRHITGGA